MRDIAKLLALLSAPMALLGMQHYGYGPWWLALWAVLFFGAGLMLRFGREAR